MPPVFASVKVVSLSPSWLATSVTKDISSLTAESKISRAAGSPASAAAATTGKIGGKTSSGAASARRCTSAQVAQFN